MCKRSNITRPGNVGKDALEVSWSRRAFRSTPPSYRWIGRCLRRNTSDPSPEELRSLLGFGSPPSTDSSARDQTSLPPNRRWIWPRIAETVLDLSPAAPLGLDFERERERFLVGEWGALVFWFVDDGGRIYSVAHVRGLRGLRDSQIRTTSTWNFVAYLKPNQTNYTNFPWGFL